MEAAEAQLAQPRLAEDEAALDPLHAVYIEARPRAAIIRDLAFAQGRGLDGDGNAIRARVDCQPQDPVPDPELDDREAFEFQREGYGRGQGVGLMASKQTRGGGVTAH